MELFASIPYLGSKKVLDAIKQFKKMRKVVEGLQFDVEVFKSTTWYFDSREMQKVISLLNA